MDHQAFAQLLGNYGEFVAAIAVVITLGYLAVQVKQAKLGLRASTYQQLLSERANLNMTISTSEGLANICQRGFSEEHTSLSRDERQRFHSVALQAFLLFNSIHRLYESRVIDEDDWRIDEGLLMAWKSAPVFQSWWSIQKHLFRPAFVRMV